MRDRGIVAKVLIIAGVGLLACALPMRRFVDQPIIWHDADQYPVVAPESYWSPLMWDVADKTLFMPLARSFLLRRAGRAKNINALGEVPNSSWYTNRLTVRRMSSQEIVAGPCSPQGGAPSTSSTWRALSGKTDGANPGFVIEDTHDGRRYLIKFDSARQPERATTADVIGSKIYWAAGLSTPCNSVVYFLPGHLVVAPHATKKDALGRTTKLTDEDIAQAISSAPRTEEGVIRASASLFLEGKVLGPFTYEGVRSDDPNDVIAHEDRRELRGSRLLAAWLNHFDAREQNTLTTFIQAEESTLGFVRHHIIDFGDCLGSRWDSDEMTRRFGHSYYFDMPHVALDFLTLGLIKRPWEQVRIAEQAPMFGYYGTEAFDPVAWKAAYPNSAFDRMDDQDAFWAARIISRFSNKTLSALVDAAYLSDEDARNYLLRVLIARRDSIVRTYFERMSAMDVPKIKNHQICSSDLMQDAGLTTSAARKYQVRTNGGSWQAPTQLSTSGFCQDVPTQGVGAYIIVEARAAFKNGAFSARPVQFHMIDHNASLRLIGILR